MVDIGEYGGMRGQVPGTQAPLSTPYLHSNHRLGGRDYWLYTPQEDIFILADISCVNVRWALQYSTARYNMYSAEGCQNARN